MGTRLLQRSVWVQLFDAAKFSPEMAMGFGAAQIVLALLLLLLAPSAAPPAAKGKTK